MKKLCKLRIAEIAFHEAQCISEMDEVSRRKVFTQLFIKYTGGVSKLAAASYYQMIKHAYVDSPFN